ADLAVLSADPLTVVEKAIPELTAVMTMVGGGVVHETPAWSGELHTFRSSARLDRSRDRPTNASCHARAWPRAGPPRQSLANPSAPRESRVKVDQTFRQGDGAATSRPLGRPRCGEFAQVYAARRASRLRPRSRPRRHEPQGAETLLWSLRRP